jgi:hypothetical protein
MNGATLQIKRPFDPCRAGIHRRQGSSRRAKLNGS